jgi:hypothetical protein
VNEIKGGRLLAAVVIVKKESPFVAQVNPGTARIRGV